MIDELNFAIFHLVLQMQNFIKMCKISFIYFPFIQKNKDHKIYGNKIVIQMLFQTKHQSQKKAFQ